MSLRTTIAVVTLILGPVGAASCSGSSPDETTSAPTTSAVSTTILEGSPASLQITTPGLASTTLGPIEGTIADRVTEYLSIPYAEPPVGENRFAAPVAKLPFDEVFTAGTPGAACPQAPSTETALFTVPPSDEDCLTLDVWAPTDVAGLPVMVFLHGGGLSGQSAHQPLYDGANLAAEGVLVVGVNYRLGALGFLAGSTFEREDGGVGNLGLLDQRLALQWVQDNAAAFGGDPDNVTLFGESAGGFSVCAHLASPGSLGLFKRAIIQSGSGCNNVVDLPIGEQQAVVFAAAAGCGGEDVAACLRELSAEEIVAADPSFNASFVRDGVELTETAFELAERDALPPVDLIIGSNADEWTFFSIGFTEPDDAAYRDLAGQFGITDVDALLDLYPASDFGSNLAAYQAMGTDVVFVCPALAFADVASDDVALRQYHITYLPDPDPIGLGTTHGAELPFLFENPDGIVGLSFDDAMVNFGQVLQRAWVGFATDGEPQITEPWPTHTIDDPAIMLLDNPLEVASGIRGQRCDTVHALR